MALKWPIELSVKAQTSPKVVIIMGLGGSNVVWGDTLVKGLEEGGYELLMFDNRDVGGSTRLRLGTADPVVTAD